MNEAPNQSTLSKLVEDAADLAGRALGYCVLRFVDACVPARYADNVKGHAGLALLEGVDVLKRRPSHASEH
jgi:hypothetical protein